MSLYEKEPIMVKLEMNVLDRKGDWVLVQYFTDPTIAETFLYNTKEEKCYGGYLDIDAEELTEDWYRLTGDTRNEE
ncbi:hypothetical protein [Sphaerochaeta globosa]|uniref:Uncharacterized protein n=1 Tax=Sphaerochaeta globosa (strain ATCC BAA-1886 / DSM 22777 / Buddy) TaxID=158189 RepID=F0RWN9_SPHGB|nr:hypothetical protein [Sphaerochaeta globosa]ADY13670.1 hypothetical protein SpiBuddy_1846 [Sphaerochaeta globosa str. Buddy]